MEITIEEAENLAKHHLGEAVKSINAAMKSLDADSASGDLVAAMNGITRGQEWADHMRELVRDKRSRDQGAG